MICGRPGPTPPVVKKPITRSFCSPTIRSRGCLRRSSVRGCPCWAAAARDVRMVLPEDQHRPLQWVFHQVSSSLFGHELDDEMMRQAMIFAGCADDTPMTAFSEVIDRCYPVRGQRAAKPAMTSLEEGLVASLARSYDPILRGRKLQTTAWPPAAFLLCDPRGAPVDGPIQLVGPARYLTFGPYFSLPAGLWDVEVSLEARDCWSDNRIGIDIASSTILAAVTSTLPK